MLVNIEEIEAAGLDVKVVRSIARKLSNAAKEAEKHGIQIFGGSGSGSLRFNDSHEMGNLIIAHLDCYNWDGGDGGNCFDADGLERGEF